MKSNTITNVLLGGLIVLLIVCTAVIQQEMRTNRLMMRQWLDQQTGATAESSSTSYAAERAAPGTPAAEPGHAQSATSPASAPPMDATKPAPAQPAPPANVASTEPPVPPPAPAPAAAAAAPPTADDIAARQWAQYGEQVTGIIGDLLSGKYDEVVKQFNGEFKASLPRAQLANEMNKIRQTHGGLVRVISHQPIDAPLPPNVHAFGVTAATEKGEPLIFTITLDANGKIAGLYLQ